MRNKSRTKWLIAGLLLVAAVGAAGLHFAARKLQDSVVEALGPNSEVGAIHLRWNGVEIEGLRIKAIRGWPAPDELRATRILVAPDLRSLVSTQIRIRRIEIDGAYLSLLRTSAGKLRLLPSLLEKPERQISKRTMPAILIGRIALKEVAITLFDASIRVPPLAIRSEAINADIDGIALPELSGRTTFDVRGTIKGVKHSGSIALQGWAEIASRDSEVRTQLRNIDLVTLQPYLLKSANSGVRLGTLDLNLDASVKAKQLKAPGTVTLHNLELDTESGGFMGLPRRAAVSMLKDKKKDIVAKFELSGNIDDPNFSLNESIAVKFGAALADSMGVSIEGIARGASSVGGALGSAADGAGKAIKGLFGK